MSDMRVTSVEERLRELGMRPLAWAPMVLDRNLVPELWACCEPGDVLPFTSITVSVSGPTANFMAVRCTVMESTQPQDAKLFSEAHAVQLLRCDVPLLGVSMDFIFTSCPDVGEFRLWTCEVAPER